MATLSTQKQFPVYPSCYVGWDNSPRRGADGIVFINGSPDTFELDLRRAFERACARPPADRLVFIDAWNEWAEGNHLEPDRRYGRAYLETVRRVAAEYALQRGLPGELAAH
jgi:hypothetical protein